MQNIQNVIGNRHVSFKIPAMPFVSNLWRTKNSTTQSSSAKNSSSTISSDGQSEQQIGVNLSAHTKPGGHQPGTKFFFKSTHFSSLLTWRENER